MLKREYWIRTPSKDRKTFRIYERVGGRGGKPVDDPRITAINTALKSGVIDLSTASLEIQRLKEELQQPQRTERYPIAEVNRDLFDKYWATKYSRRKALDDSKRSAKNFYLRALSSLSSLSLLTAPIEILQNAVDKQPPRKQRRICNCLNRVLAYHHRPDRLALAQKQDLEYRYLDEKDFKSILIAIGDEKLRLVCQVAFYSGLRLGELFAVREFYTEDSTVFVEKQMHENGTYGPTKNKKQRRTFVCPEGTEFLKRWIEFPTTERRNLRKRRWADIVRAACEKAFPKSPEKHLNFHDLRHSYAIHCLRGRLSLTVVAASLGDGLNVAQEYYARFERTSDLGILAKKMWRVG